MNSRELEDLLKQLAPIDLANVPVYVMKISDGLPSTLMPDGMTYALTTKSLDMVLRPHLNGRPWEGRGVGILLNDYVIRGHAALNEPDDPGKRKKLVEQRTVASCIHELGHVMEYDIDLTALSEKRVRSETAALTGWCESPITPEAMPAKWLCHSGRWLRNILHLHYRARKLGIDCPLSMLTTSEEYGHSPIWQYESAIGDEPVWCAEASFKEIRALKPPKAFHRRWKMDVADWFKSIPKPSSLDVTTLTVFSGIFEVKEKCR